MSLSSWQLRRRTAWTDVQDILLNSRIVKGLKSIVEIKFFKPFACWMIWLISGTIFYTHALNMGWYKGFYMAVNVGYSIGWGYPTETSPGVRYFSTMYVLTGASAVAASLGYFAKSMIASSKRWYAIALQEERFAHGTYFQKLIIYIKMNDSSFKIIGIWLVWIICMVAFSTSTVKWDFSQALYFAVSSLSTGGLWAVPSDSPEWYFGVVGFFAATGIPLMAMAMANIASMLITIGDPDEAEKTIAAKVTSKELRMMQKFELDDGDGQISRAEYILLCTVRLGALCPSLITKINERFERLDTDGDGSLSYSEILEHYYDGPDTVRNKLHIRQSQRLPYRENECLSECSSDEEDDNDDCSHHVVKQYSSISNATDLMMKTLGGVTTSRIEMIVANEHALTDASENV